MSHSNVGKINFNYILDSVIKPNKECKCLISRLKQDDFSGLFRMTFQDLVPISMVSHPLQSKCELMTGKSLKGARHVS